MPVACGIMRETSVDPFRGLTCVISFSFNKNLAGIRGG